MTSIICTLELIRCPLDTEHLLDVICPDCGSPIIIHQPDERLPDRLLGTCASCSAWYLIFPAAAAIVRLPEEEALDGSREGRPPRASAVLVGQHRD